MMYYTLIKEEMGELIAAYNTDDRVEQLDALIDILVVTIGALHSMGCYPEDAWNEVMRTNFVKVDPVTGKVTRREDGKILKPEGWQPPRLERYLHD
jgi:predicted HAD superfamily Cof-like phosphohydrolase